MHTQTSISRWYSHADTIHQQIIFKKTWSCYIFLLDHCTGDVRQLLVCLLSLAEAKISLKSFLWKTLLYFLMKTTSKWPEERFKGFKFSGVSFKSLTFDDGFALVDLKYHSSSIRNKRSFWQALARLLKMSMTINYIPSEAEKLNIAFVPVSLRNRLYMLRLFP